MTSQQWDYYKKAGHTDSDIILRSSRLYQSTEATFILVGGQGVLALAADDVAHAAVLSCSAGVTPDGVLLVLSVVPGGRRLVCLGFLLRLLG